MRFQHCTILWMFLGLNGVALGVDVGKYDTFETNVMNYNSYSNSFQDVTLNATLTSPSAQTISIRGFYDGNNTWQIRFMPDELGTWTYACTFSDGASGKSGSFQCIASHLHGPLKTDAVTPVWWKHADGTPVFIRAFHLWYPDSFEESRLEDTLDFAKEKEFNTIVAPHLTSSYHIPNGVPDNPDRMPWQGTYESPDFWRYNLPVWRELDTMIRKCAERGMVVIPFAIFGGTNGLPKMTEWGQQQQFIRYWVARWGGFWNVTYCPMSEYDKMFSETEMAAILDEIYSADGGRHPVTTHNCGIDKPTNTIKQRTSFTYHTIQDKLDDYNPAAYKRFVDLYRGAPKPILAHECLWEGNQYQGAPSLDMNNMRKGAWCLATCGGAYINYADECLPGHQQISDQTASQTFATKGTAVAPQGWFYPYIAHLGNFMQAVPFWRMSLQKELSSMEMCLAKTDYWYVAYTMGGSFTLNLSAASSAMIGRWYNPRTGEYGAEFSVSPGGIRTMTPPDSNDWVLYVSRDVDATPPSPVSSFTVTAGEHKNTLIWTNPSSSDFIATVICYKTTGHPTSPSDGNLLVDLADMPGTTNTYVHAGLRAGATYYYTAFARDDEYHYASGVQAGASPDDYKRVTVDLGTTDTEQGMYRVTVSDGDTTVVDIGGKNCRKNAVAGDDNYIYFGVADAYMYAGYRPDCYIMVEYWDTGTGTLTLQYDSTSAAYTTSSAVTLTNSNTWKKHEFHVTDAYFGNRQNNGADFRIACTSGATFYLNEVSVANVSMMEQPPLISPVARDPDVISVGTEYVCQLTLSQGRPLPSWTIIQGPEGIQVDGSGQVYDWTPDSTFAGQIVDLTVRVTNSEGYSDKSWQVMVFNAIDQSGFDSDADGWTLVTWKAGQYDLGTMAWDFSFGHPDGNLLSTGNGSTNGTDSCTREGGSMTKVMSTANYEDIHISYDVITTLNTSPSSGCTGNCASTVVEGSCEDKLAVYYSTSGINGPWTLVQVLAEGVDLPRSWTNQLINLSDVPAVQDNANFAIRFVWQFNTATDAGRIDNVKILGNLNSGLSPAQASNPYPARQSTGIDRHATLSWTAGVGAISHDVYFGATSPPVFQGNQTGTTFDPGLMVRAQTYYWRIDERNDTAVTTGDVWQFTIQTAPGDFDVDGDVDLTDFGYLQGCYSGSGVAPRSGCTDANLDGDNDVDQADFDMFKTCFGGADRPAGC